MNSIKNWMGIKLPLGFLIVVLCGTFSFAEVSFFGNETTWDTNFLNLPLEKEKELKKPVNFLKREFLLTTPASEALIGLKKIQDAEKLTDQEIIQSFWYARIKLVFNWDVNTEIIIAQLMFVLDKYLVVVEEFCDTEVAFSETLHTIRSLPISHLLNPNLGLSIQKFLSQLTISCNKSFPASAAYQDFITQLFHAYADSFLTDLNQREFYKGFAAGLCKLEDIHKKNAACDAFIMGFFEGLLNNPMPSPSNLEDTTVTIL